MKRYGGMRMSKSCAVCKARKWKRKIRWGITACYHEYVCQNPSCRAVVKTWHFFSREERVKLRRLLRKLRLKKYGHDIPEPEPIYNLKHDETWQFAFNKLMGDLSAGIPNEDIKEALPEVVPTVGVSLPRVAPMPDTNHRIVFALRLRLHKKKGQVK